SDAEGAGAVVLRTILPDERQVALTVEWEVGARHHKQRDVCIVLERLKSAVGRGSTCTIVPPALPAVRALRDRKTWSAHGVRRPCSALANEVLAHLVNVRRREDRGGKRTGWIGTEVDRIAQEGDVFGHHFLNTHGKGFWIGGARKPRHPMQPC